jgi:hypothetical protein
MLEDTKHKHIYIKKIRTLNEMPSTTFPVHGCTMYSTIAECTVSIPQLFI